MNLIAASASWTSLTNPSIEIPRTNSFWIAWRDLSLSFKGRRLYSCKLSVISEFSSKTIRWMPFILACINFSRPTFARPPKIHLRHRHMDDILSRFAKIYCRMIDDQFNALIEAYHCHFSFSHLHDIAYNVSPRLLKVQMNSVKFAIFVLLQKICCEVVRFTCIKKWMLRSIQSIIIVSLR